MQHCLKKQHTGGHASLTLVAIWLTARNNIALAEHHKAIGLYVTSQEKDELLVVLIEMVI